MSIGMMGDAGDETMALLRFTEPENYDKSQAQDQVRRLIEALIALFEHGIYAIKFHFPNVLLYLYVVMMCLTKKSKLQYVLHFSFSNLEF